jgi:hypothetical protein
MSRPLHISVVTLAGAALLVGVAAAKDPARIPGSKARQLLLKQALKKQLEGTLVSELNRNKQVYTSLKLNPQQLRDLREKVYMFKQLDPDRQVDILEAAEEFLSLTPEQRKTYRESEAWLRKVVASLTPQQREALKRLTPEQRAKRLLELRDKLLGSKPTTQPATRPAPSTAPAK